MEMTMRFTELDAAGIIDTLILSDLDLGRWPARMRAARAILRAIVAEYRISPVAARAAYREIRSERANLMSIARAMRMPTLLAIQQSLEIAVAISRDDLGAIYERLTPMGGDGIPNAYLLEHLIALRTQPPSDLLARIEFAHDNQMGLWPATAALIDSLKTSGATADVFSPLLHPASRAVCAWDFMVADHSIHAPLAALVMASDATKSTRHDLERHKKRLIRIVREVGQRLGNGQAAIEVPVRMLASVIDGLATRTKMSGGASHLKRPSALQASLRAFEMQGEQPPVDGRLVIPAINKQSVGHHIRSAGDELPVVRSSMSAIRQAMRDLPARYPWLAQPIADILGGLFVAAGEEVRIHPTILVGPPGCGKTRLIGEIAKALALPRLFLAATGDDVAVDLCGSSARWSTSQPSLLTTSLDRFRTATMLVHLDEIEKTPIRRDHPSLLDSLLTVLEPSTAGQIRDPALNVDIDASGVSWLFTANSLRGIPDALIDRCRVIKCLAPGIEHLKVLAMSIGREIMVARGYTEDDFEDFDEVELHLLAKTWRGGSTRALQRIVEAMIVARQAWDAGPSLN